VIDADLVITAIGVTPNTDFLKGVALDKDGGVNADVFLRSTNQKDVFAAGDLVSYPYFYENKRIRVEHLSEAFNHGTYAAWNMLGKMIPYNGVPFFWTRQWNKSVACVGHLDGGWDKVVIDGKPSEYNFAAYYFKNNKLIGASGMMRSKDLMAINHAIRINMPITEEYFNGTALDVERLKTELLAKGPKCNCSRAKNNKAPCRD
jgi:NADPH-dependent 2,4-dienoyl-CoA reductase/sulfur reductase-like enzyme